MTTTTLPAGITQADLDRAAALSAAMVKAKTELDSLKAKIKAAYNVPGTYVSEGIVVKLTEAVGLDAKKVEEAFPYSDYPDFYTPKVDPKKVPDFVKGEYFTITQRLTIERAS